MGFAAKRKRRRPTASRARRRPSGETLPNAAMLLRQGHALETDWIEDIDVLVPMATSLSSYEDRSFELAEELAEDLGLRLCLPVVDALR
jgi:predicted amidophosphoribosyltransferase